MPILRDPIRVFHWFCLELLAGALLGYIFCVSIGWIPLGGKETPVFVEERPESVIVGERSNQVRDANPPNDTDGDGLPNDWELANFHDPADPGDAGSDFDRDGVTAFQEFTNGTNAIGKWTATVHDMPAGLGGTGVSLYVSAVNASGTVLVNRYTYDPATGSETYRSFLVDSQQDTWEEITPVPGEITWAHDLNDRGTVCFEHWTSDWGQGGGRMRTADGQVVVLEDSEGGEVIPLRINNDDDWVGYALPAWTAASSVWGGTSSSATGWTNLSYSDINDFGEVLGSFGDPVSGSRLAFLEYGAWFFSTGLPQDYPFLTPGGTASNSPSAINRFGEFAGSAVKLPATSSARSYVFNGQYTAWKLNGSHLVGSPVAIDDSGRVLIGQVGYLNQPAALAADSVAVPLSALSSQLPQSYTGIAMNGAGVIGMSDSQSNAFFMVKPDQDRDGDGLPDDWETAYGLNPDAPGDASMDADGDGIANLAEFKLGSNPTLPPAFDDEGEEIDLRPGIDTDGDGLPNLWEWEMGLDHENPADASADLDHDRHTNLMEYRLGTDIRGAPLYEAIEIEANEGTVESHTLQLAGYDAETDTITVTGVLVPQSGGRQPFRWSKTGDEAATVEVLPSPESVLAGQTVSYVRACRSNSRGDIFWLVKLSSSGYAVVWWPPGVGTPVSHLMTDAVNADLHGIAPESPEVILYRSLTTSPYYRIYRVRGETGAIQLQEVPAPPGATILTSTFRMNSDGWISGLVRQGSIQLPGIWKPSGSSWQSFVLPTSYQDYSPWFLSEGASPVAAGMNASKASAWREATGLQDLGTLGGSSSKAEAVSPSGLVAGSSDYLDPVSNLNVRRAFLAREEAGGTWTKQAIHGSDPAELLSVSSVNDLGEVVGVAAGAAGNFPYIWRYGETYYLKDLLPDDGMVYSGFLGNIGEGGHVLAGAYESGVMVVRLMRPTPDTDGDGMNDAWETSNGFNPYAPEDGPSDADGDGLPNREEAKLSTDPRQADTDGDGMPDGWEVAWYLSPRDSADASADPDQDRVTNRREYQLGTSPLGLYKVHELPDVGGKVHFAIQASGDGSRLLAYTTPDGTNVPRLSVYVRDMTGSFVLERHLPTHTSTGAIMYYGAVRDGGTVYGYANNSGWARPFRLLPGTSQEEFLQVPDLPATGGMYGFIFSPDGTKLMASGYWTGISGSRIFDLPAAGEAPVLGVFQNELTNYPDEWVGFDWVVWTHLNNDGTALGHGEVTSADVPYLGPNAMATYSDGWITLYPCPSNTLLADTEESPCEAFTGSGRAFVRLSDQTLGINKIWELDTWTYQWSPVPRNDKADSAMVLAADSLPRLITKEGKTWLRQYGHALPLDRLPLEVETYDRDDLGTEIAGRLVHSALFPGAEAAALVVRDAASGSYDTLVVEEVSDTDDDGLPDDWELSYLDWLGDRDDTGGVQLPGGIHDLDPEDDPVGDGVSAGQDYDSSSDGYSPWEPGKRAILDYSYKSASAGVRGYYPALDGSEDFYATKEEEIVRSKPPTTSNGTTTTENGNHRQTTELDDEGEWQFNETTSGYSFPYWSKVLNSSSEYIGTWTTTSTFQLPPNADDDEVTSRTTTLSYPQSPASDPATAKKRVVEQLKAAPPPPANESTGNFFPDPGMEGEVQEGTTATLKTAKDGFDTYTIKLRDKGDRSALATEALNKARSEAKASNYGIFWYHDRDTDSLDHNHRSYYFDVMGYRGRNPLNGNPPLADGVESGYSELLLRINTCDQPLVLVVRKMFWADFDGEPRVEEERISLDAGVSRSLKIAADPGSDEVVICSVDVVYGGSSHEILDVNGGDNDGDAVPDFADGLEDVFEDEGHRPVHTAPDGSDDAKSAGYDVSTGAGAHLLGGTGGDAFGALLDNQSARFRISYPASDPALMTREVQILPDQTQRVIYEPAPGSLRLWKKPLHERRKAASITQDGDFLPSGSSWIARNKLVSEDEYPFVYVESVKASESMADQTVVMEVDVDGDGHADVTERYYFSSIGMGFWEVDPQTGATTRRLGALINSLPAPKLQIGQVQILNPRPSANGDSMVVDIAFSGSVSSAVCDLTKPGEKGDRITRAFAMVNDTKHPQAVVNVSGSKTSSGHMGRPYPFDGQFSHSMTDVIVTEGTNVLRITVADPLYSQSSQASVDFEISAVPGSLASWTLGGSLDIATVVAEVSFPGGDATQAIVTLGDTENTPLDGVNLSRVAVDHTLYTAAGSSLELRLSAPFTANASVIQSISGTLSGGVFSNPLQLTGLPETASDSNLFRWSATEMESYYATGDYTGWTVRVDSVGSPVVTGPGEHHPMALKIEGPDELVAGLGAVDLAGEKLKVVRSGAGAEQGFFVASQMDPEKPATIMVVNKPRVTDEAMPGTGYDAPPSSDPDWVDEEDDGIQLGSLEYVREYFDRNTDGEVSAEDFLVMMNQRAQMLANDATSAQFYKGIMAGLIGNPMDTGKDIVGLFKAGSKAAVDVITVTNPVYITGRVIYEFVWGDQFRGEIDAAKRAWESTVGWAKEAAAFIQSIAIEGYARIIEFMVNPESPGYAKLSHAARIAVDLVFMLMIAGEQYWNSIGEYNRGYAIGYVTFEVIVTVGAAILTAPAAGSGALVTLGRHSPKLLKLVKLARPAIARLSGAKAEFGGVLGLFDKVIDWLTFAKFQKWCFVAGTPIMTMAGPVPIERIDEGMMVLSAEESGAGAPCFRPVIGIHRSESPEVWRISYDPDSDASTPDAVLTASAEHPLWVRELGSFVPACEIQAGQTLRLAEDSRPAPVTSVVRQIAPEGRAFKLYNFSVADYHTYFAGDGGVWVHNLCPEALKRIWNRFECIYDRNLKNGMANEAAWDDALQKVMRSISRSLDFSKDTAYRDLGDAAAKVLSESAKKIPDSTLAERWDLLVNQFARVRRIDDPNLKREGGSAFDVLRAAYYRSRNGYDQVKLSNGKRLDSYIPNSEIVSRKWKQYFLNGRADFIEDLNELVSKYAPPNIVVGGSPADKKRGLDALIQTNHQVEGALILEIPVQKTPIPSAWLEDARTRGVMIRDVAGNVIQDIVGP